MGGAVIGHGLTVLLALLSAAFLAVGIVARQRATIDVPAELGVSPVMIQTLIRRPLWWAGTSAAIAGYVFQALALANGSLLLVQPILTSALLFALPLSARLAHRRVSRGEWAWALLLTAALAVFVVLAKARPGDYEASLSTSAVVAVVCTAAVSACVVVATRVVGWRRAVLLAVAVGVLFGVVAVLTKLVMHVLTHDGPLAVLTTPVLYLLALLGVLAMLLQQSAFHAGSLQTSVPTMLVLEPVVAVVLGAVVLGEHLEVGRWDAVALAVSTLAMAAATIALGRDEGAFEEQLEAVVVERLEPVIAERSAAMPGRPPADPHGDNRAV
ncbi:hypothetical protein NGTWS0302_27080 [Mycolicibacterium cyprinidarum]|uniref:Multidrug DMT transporter permease n=1 Tax=Mycolicibacterium cyprinidarum TaxID=2860311 RepID=A0ABQ4VD76_9MYCO|nr:hypothetical protein NGTWS0302_27080 [Mycolicibacterium sp. NGTWS0302]GJF14863.1 hypothetical protein NGTWS1702_17380 [Mycolicibacterium sp. NGTWSNA01]